MRRPAWFLLLAVVGGSLIGWQQAAAEVNYTGGFYERARYEYWKNYRDMNNARLDNRGFFRFKTSLWGQADIDNAVSFYAKLTDEFKAYTLFAGTTGSVPDKSATKKGYHFNISEVVFDNLYADINNFLGAPVDLRLGRQDFLGAYGEGFLIMDGTPQDGSRTYYFNAAKASWRVNDTNAVDVIYMNDPRDEEFLPVMNRVMLVNVANPNRDKVPQLLNTTDEQGAVLYWKNRDIQGLTAEGYYIYKTEAEEGGVSVQARKSKLHTFGTYAKYNFAPWTLRGQFAYQTGDYGHDKRQGIGGYGFIDQTFKDVTWSPTLSAGYLYLSGDDRSTSKNEGWDPLFSRYPWISDLYVLSMGSEIAITSYWTNLRAARLELTCKPTQKSKLSLWYNYFWANENPAAGTILSGNSRNRGQLPQFRFDYTFNKNVSTYAQVEYFKPDDFYVADNSALFVRGEVQVKF